MASITSELSWLGDRNMYNKVVRRYKKLRKMGAYPDAAGYTAMLNACMRGKIGAVADKVVLDMMVFPPEDGFKMSDMVMALTACARSSRPVEALEILAAMEQMPAADNVRPNMQCYALTMEAIKFAPSHLPIEELARRVMKQVRISKLELTAQYYKALLQVLVRVRRYKEALACFDLLCLEADADVRAEHYEAAMRAACVLKDQESVKSLLGEVLMDEQRFKSKYSSIMSLAAKALANANNWRLAVKVLEKIPSPRSYDVMHACIASVGRGGNAILCRSLFNSMKAEGHRPNRATYNAVLHACSSAGELEDAKLILDEMSASGISLNVVTYNIALNSRARVGDARGAINLLAEMDRSGIEASVVSYATAINAAAQFNSSSLAVTLLDTMMTSGEVVPNEYVFTAALTACENDPDNSAAATAAQRIVDAMAEVGVADMSDKLRNRLAAQARRMLSRDVAARDVDNLSKDEEALGITLKGRQEAV